MMARKTRRALQNKNLMWGIIAGTIVASSFAYSAGKYPESLSQVAVGTAADAQCLGNYDPQEQYPKISPKTKKQGLIGKPCMDETNGGVTTGTCQAMGKCKGEKTGGMPPMLPMLPMPMPKPDMPMPPNCATIEKPKMGTSTSGEPAAPTPARDPSCPPESTGVSSGISSWLFGDSSTNNTSGNTSSGPNTPANSKPAGSSAWSNLLQSLGLSSGTTDSSSSVSTNSNTNTNAGGTGAPGQVLTPNAAIQNTSGTVQPTQGAPNASGGSPPGTFVSSDLSGSRGRETTFTFAGNSSASPNTGTVLANIASTLRRMLDTIRTWTQ